MKETLNTKAIYTYITVYGRYIH